MEDKKKTYRKWKVQEDGDDNWGDNHHQTKFGPQNKCFLYHEAPCAQHDSPGVSKDDDFE